MLGCPLQSMAVVGGKRIQQKLESIVNNPHQTPHETMDALRNFFSQRP